MRQLAAQRVDFVKMWVESRGGRVPKIEDSILVAIVEEAEKYGIPLIAHISDQSDIKKLAKFGVTDFLHTVRNSGAMGADFVEMCRGRGVHFTPTLSIHHTGWYWAENPNQLDKPEVQVAFDEISLDFLLDREARTKSLQDPTILERKARYKHAKSFVLQMHRAGVPIAVGSDSGAGNVAMGWGTHHEMELLVEAGLTPMEALTAATGGAAMLLDKGRSERGVLKAGNIADLLLLEADPLVDISNTRKIERVMQAGNWVH